MVFFFTSSNEAAIIYMGRDKYENEELIKYAYPHDIWFHVDKLSSAHVYLRMKEPIDSYDQIPEDVLQECAQITKDNSIEGCKKSSIDITYTWATNLLKNDKMEVGAVTFKDYSKVKKIRIERDKEIVKKLTKTKEEKDYDLKQDRDKYLMKLQKEEQLKKKEEMKKKQEEDKKKKQEEEDKKLEIDMFKQDKDQTNQDVENLEDDFWCQDCEIFLCQHCDYQEHVPQMSPGIEEYESQTITHKRIRICEECEEQECATQCLNCEQFLCNPCNNRLHQKGARQKHKRQKHNLSPPLIGPGKRKSSYSSTGKHVSLGQTSEFSRKNSTETDYFTEQNHDKQLNYSHSFQSKDQKHTYYNRYNEYQAKQGYMSMGKPGKGSHQRGGKGSCQSSGGSSTGSHQNSYSNFKSQDNLHNPYPSSRSHNKYKKNSGHHTSSHGTLGQQNSQELIPPQYFEGDTVVIPIWQPLVKCEESSQEMIVLQKELFNLAYKGDLLIEYNQFIAIIQEKLSLQEKECFKLVEIAENQGIIHQTKRSFAKMKTLCFVSLQLEIISHECLSWVLTSLKQDEMTPTERAVQSRIKEAFAFKITGPLWECIMDSIQNKEITQVSGKQRQVTVQTVGTSKTSNKFQQSNSNTYNDYYNVSKNKQKNTQYQQIQFIYQDKKNCPNYEFKIKEIEEDPSIGQMTKALYLKDQEEWIGVDQSFEDIDYTLYEELKKFLQSYFCENQDTEESDEKWCSSIENALTRNNNGSYSQSQKNHQEIDFEEIRAIPGGRYGCAQFVKICGPLNLKRCSLGRLAQLVQQAIKEDVLRYHKTLLVWTTSVDKHKKLEEEMQKEQHQNEIKATKLNIVKNALIEILAESKTGMSLAQLPLYLRRKLLFNLDLNELGFPKLKDLILSMSDKIKLELRGHNHPFAYLIKSGRYVHSTSNSDDFQNIPKNKNFIKTSQPHLSEDVNISRHLKNALAMNEGNVQTVLTAFYNLMRESPMGIKSNELCHAISNKIGYQFNYKAFQCNSLLEFLKKFIMPTMDIEIISSDPSENDIFIIRSKQIFMAYNYDLAQNQQFMMQKAMQKQSQRAFEEMKEGIQRQNSSASSFNVSSQSYIPNAQSLYGGSTSANTSTHQVNVSHIRFNTADTFDLPQQAINNQMYQMNQAQQLQQNNSKPPLAPQILQEKIQQQQAIQNQSKSNSYRTYPPPQQIFQQQPTYQQAYLRHQQSPSNVTNMSNQSIGLSQLPQSLRGGFFLTPNQLQQKQDSLPFSNNQNSPIHSRAESSNYSALGTAGAMKSTTSKSVSQDFSNQSKNNTYKQPFKTVQYGNLSGFTTPQYPQSYLGQQQQVQGQTVPQNIESIFSSPDPRSYIYDTGSINKLQYLEGSPQQENDDEEGNLDQNIKFIERLVCDDEIDYKSNDEHSSQSMHSPHLSTSGLRVPVSSFQGQGPNMNQRQAIRNTSNSNSKGILNTNKQNNALTGITEGDSSSSEDKRPSIVQEQKTEEDAEDTSNGGGTQQSKNNSSTQIQDNNGDCIWSNEAQLF